jgi:hypothetical protein
MRLPGADIQLTRKQVALDSFPNALAPTERLGSACLRYRLVSRFRTSRIGCAPDYRATSAVPSVDQLYRGYRLAFAPHGDPSNCRSL